MMRNLYLIVTLSLALFSGKVSGTSSCTVATQISILVDEEDGKCPGIKDAYITIDDTSALEVNDKLSFISAADVTQLTEQMQAMQSAYADMKREFLEMRSTCSVPVVQRQYATSKEAVNRTTKLDDVMETTDDSRYVEEIGERRYEIVKKPEAVYEHSGIGARILKHTVAHFKFDQDANDATTNSYNGHVIGEVEFESGSGVKGGAARFKLGNGKINVDSFRLYPWGSGFSVSMWIKRTADWNKQTTILSNGDATYGTWDVRMGSQYSGQMIGANIFTCGSGGDWTYQDILAEHNAWHHVVLSFDGTKLDFYLDGLKRVKHHERCTGLDSDMPTRDTPLTIGGGGVGSRGQYFTGLVDELVIFNISLTNEEVKFLHDLNDPHECDNPYIVAYFPFEEDTNDQSCHQRRSDTQSELDYDEIRGFSAVFNGYRQIEMDLLKNYPYGNQFSVSLWYKRTGNYGEEQSIVWHHTWEICVQANSRLAGTVKPKVSPSKLVIGQSSTYPYNNILATDDEWHHVVMTYDGSLLQFYVDGVQQSGEDECCRGNMLIPEKKLIIGARINPRTSQRRRYYGQATAAPPVLIGNNFHGFIDEVRLYRQVLYQEEVTRLFSVSN